MNKIKIIFLLLLVVAVFAGIVFFFKYFKEDVGRIVWPLEKEKVTKKVGDLDIVGSGDFAINDAEIPQEQNQPDKKATVAEIPDLDREVKISAVLPEDSKKILENKIMEVSAVLKKDPSLSDYWLELGRLRSAIGDYEGAKLAWEYLTKIRPENFVPFNNLGELYAYYLKDYKKAEENYAKAVERGPENIPAYRNFYEFYRFVLKNDAKAKAILEQGIAANLGNASLDLQNLLKNY